ncbi:zinc metalloproteinase dpy-31-like [Liolophura sinensis]|uniref:zinc metalloproteinase dpy-31-like n=1 Tax=Liolophura sinensis TaxID=3198878 RepID=UPI003158B873
MVFHCVKNKGSFCPEFFLTTFILIHLDLTFLEVRQSGVEGRVATFGEEVHPNGAQAVDHTASGLLYEGDIILTEEQRLELTSGRVKRESTNKRIRRKITTNLSERWSLPINYTFDGSHVGFVSNHSNQRISIGEDCLWMGTIAHEIGHAVGFWHEQARPDRDDYVTVLIKNVIPDRRYNFQKSNWGEVMSYGVPYDVGSLMHYGSKFFSLNKMRTIKTRDPRLQRVVGQRDGLSFADTKLANFAYCSDICDNTSGSLRCHNDGYPDPLNCSVCRCPDGLGGRTCDTVAPSTAECGGVLTANHQVAYIQSPGYPRAYGSGIGCHWLIQAPPGYRIYFEFVDEFSLTEDVPNDACVNFVEVRYYESLSHTGGRGVWGLFVEPGTPAESMRPDSQLSVYPAMEEPNTSAVYPLVGLDHHGLRIYIQNSDT